MSSGGNTRSVAGHLKEFTSGFKQPSQLGPGTDGIITTEKLPAGTKRNRENREE